MAVRIGNELVTLMGSNAETMGIHLVYGTLSLSTLKASFPGASGLRYKNPSGGEPIYICVPFCALTNSFLCPNGGWNNKLLEVIYEDSRPRSPYSSVQKNLPTIEEVEPYNFYIEEGTKSCVTCISNFFFATFRHMSHLEYKIGDIVTIISNDNQNYFYAVVRFIQERLDFIILKTDRKIVEKPPHLCLLPRLCQPLMICGRGNLDAQVCSRTGSVHRENQMIENDGKSYGPFLIGTIHAVPGDSGGGVWSGDGLVGINVMQSTFPELPHTNAVKHAAEFPVVNVMVYAHHLNEAMTIVEAEDRQKLPKPEIMDSFGGSLI